MISCLGGDSEGGVRCSSVPTRCCSDASHVTDRWVTGGACKTHFHGDEEEEYEDGNWTGITLFDLSSMIIWTTS